MLKYCKVYEFPEYNYFGRKSCNCNSFLDNEKKNRYIFLPIKKSYLKKRCINIYKSEKNLNYIQFEKESFRPLQEYDYLHPLTPEFYFTEGTDFFLGTLGWMEIALTKFVKKYKNQKFLIFKC